MKAFDYEIAAKPTFYAGVRFRSRLEARWAAYFDLAGILWDYEPVDLDGWTPDFMLTTRVGSIYAEVKPMPLLVTDKGHLSPNREGAGWVFAKMAPFALAGNNILCLCAAPGDHTIGMFFSGPGRDDLTVQANQISDQLARANTRHLWRQAGTITQWRGRP